MIVRSTPVSVVGVSLFGMGLVSAAYAIAAEPEDIWSAPLGFLLVTVLTLFALRMAGSGLAWVLAFYAFMLMAYLVLRAEAVAQSWYMWAPFTLILPGGWNNLREEDPLTNAARLRAAFLPFPGVETSLASQDMVDVVRKTAIQLAAVMGIGVGILVLVMQGLYFRVRK